MRKSVRKFVGVAVVGVLGALFVLPMLTAGAQTNGSTGTDGVPPAAPGDCVIQTVTPNPVPGFPTQVTLTGTAPTTDNTTVVLFANGAPATANSPTDKVTQAITDGTWTLLYTVTGPTTLSVNFTFGNQNAYTAICATVSGQTEFNIVAEAANAARPAAALAFTGSSDTPSFVLIGIAALVVGAVLVIAARRRSQVS